jgi:hypothetical protein
MAWSISITDEGWGEIYNALHEWSKDDLLCAIEDDRIEQLFDRSRYPLPYHQQMRIWHEIQILLSYASQEALADECYDLVKKNNTCDNGGYAYWIDREGYHKVYLPEIDQGAIEEKDYDE